MTIKYYPMLVKPFQWLLTLSVIVLMGCYPKGAEYVEELDLVYTNFSNEFDFKTVTTYALPDSVIKIDGDNFNDPDGDGKPQFLSATASKAILDQIKQNMTAYGYQQVNKNANPDVILLVSSMTTTNIYYYYDWWYWDWWYGGWYGWYYPGWYYPPYVSGYRSGSIFAQMADIKGKPSGENLPIVWSFIINGLAEGGTSSITSRVQTGINKAFTQSPYLKH